MQLSELISILEGFRDEHGDLEVRTADYEFLKSDPIDGDEHDRDVEFVENENSIHAMQLDDHHNPNLVYPYILIGA